MSLNAVEQLIHDHLLQHREERHHWTTKVQSIVFACGGNDKEAASRLERDLWEYFRERSRDAEPFQTAAVRFGIQRTSMRNLAEYLIRLWAPPPSKKKTP